MSKIPLADSLRLLVKEAPLRWWGHIIFWSAVLPLIALIGNMSANHGLPSAVAAITDAAVFIALLGSSVVYHAVKVIHPKKNT